MLELRSRSGMSELAVANQANQALTRTARKVSRMIERL
jgi:hypothetical protein